MFLGHFVRVGLRRLGPLGQQLGEVKTQRRPDRRGHQRHRHRRRDDAGPVARHGQRDGRNAHDDQRKLGSLAQQEGQLRRAGHGPSIQPRGDEDHGRLHDEDHQRRRQHGRPDRRHRGQVHAHPHAHEEQAKQEAGERLDLVLHHMAIGRIRHRHAGEECAEGERKIGPRRRRACGQHDEQRHDGECLAIIRRRQ